MTEPGTKSLFLYGARRDREEAQARQEGGSNVVALPTELIDLLTRRAAIAGFRDLSTFVEHLIEGMDAGDFWDELLDAVNDEPDATA